MNAVAARQRFADELKVVTRVVSGAALAPAFVLFIGMALAGTRTETDPEMVVVPVNPVVMISAALVGAFVGHRLGNQNQPAR